MKKIDVCLSPEMVHLHKTEGKVVVVIDILRATSCMTTALANGIESITAVASLEECKALGEQGYLTAAERDGKKVDGFDFGNSPFSYQDDSLKEDCCNDYERNKCNCKVCRCKRNFSRILFEFFNDYKLFAESTGRCSTPLCWMER
jgi:hypothetical protein